MATGGSTFDQWLRDAKIRGTRKYVQLGGRRTVAIAWEDGAAAVVHRDGSVFLVKTKGPHAMDLLAEVGSNLKIGESRPPLEAVVQ